MALRSPVVPAEGTTAARCGGRRPAAGGRCATPDWGALWCRSPNRSSAGGVAMRPPGGMRRARTICRWQIVSAECSLPDRRAGRRAPSGLVARARPRGRSFSLLSPPRKRGPRCPPPQMQQAPVILRDGSSIASCSPCAGPAPSIPPATPASARSRSARGSRRGRTSAAPPARPDRRRGRAGRRHGR